MAATTDFTLQFPVHFGRSGYNNKPDEDDGTKDQGRSGYNKYAPSTPIQYPTPKHRANLSPRGDKGDDEEDGDKQSLLFSQ
jgi:hypothetical protein